MEPGGERVLVIGVGLIGGSIGMALRERSGAWVRGLDIEVTGAERAREMGALDEVSTELGPALDGVGVVVVATPVGEILATIEGVAEAAAPGTVVLDVGSTKAAIVREAERRLGADRPFVGTHPMAGTEGEGVEAARADLFEGAMWILTPTEDTDSVAYRRVNRLVTEIGASTLALDAETHDRLVARISHLPYAVATSLMSLAGEGGDPRVFRAAAGTFRDVTRTAGTNPRIWRDILATNAEAVADEIDRLVSSLEVLGAALRSGRLEEVDDLIAAARSARQRLPLKGEREPSEPVTIEVLIPDRAGVLAEVTTAIGAGGINIEDLWMEHLPSGGVLRLVLDGSEVARQATKLLGDRGFRASILEAR